MKIDGLNHAKQNIEAIIKAINNQNQRNHGKKIVLSNKYSERGQELEMCPLNFNIHKIVSVHR